VKLRDGNLGIGAKHGRQDDTFGLDLLSGLLGRLNGKSDEQLKKEDAGRRDVKLMQYQEQKKGLIGFSFGGYLVGDEIQDTLDDMETGQELKSSNETDEKDDVNESREERKTRKAERRAKKEAKRLKREQKALKKTKDENSIEPTTRAIEKPQLITIARGRHVIRQRHIQQKKMATLDEKALNQIFMIKAPT